MDRYPFTSVEDAGLGADEFEGPARFTRPVERIEAADDITLDVCVRQRMLDRAADLLCEVMQETPRADPCRDRLRDLTFVAKGLADDFARSHNLRASRPGQEDAAVTADLGGLGDDGDSNPHEED